MEIIINKCYGGFEISTKAYKEWRKRCVERNGLFIYGENTSHQFKPTNKAFSFVEEETYGKCVKMTLQDLDKSHKQFDKIFYTQKDFGDVVDTKKIPKRQRIEHLNGKKDIRVDPILIEVVKELGEKANTRVSDLEVVKIPDNMKWEILEFDGYEYLVDSKRCW